MRDYKEIFAAITSDPRYQRNLDWGKVRPGHPEGTIRAHIAELEHNLERLCEKLSETDCWRLKVLLKPASWLYEVDQGFTPAPRLKYSVVPRRSWNSVPMVVYQGTCQPIRSRKAWICGWGAVETRTTVVSRALMCASSEIWSVNIEQPRHGLPSGGCQKW